MSFGGGKQYAPEPELKTGGIEEESFNSNEEAVPVPYLAGEERIAPRWITPILNPYARKAPSNQPRKK